MDLFLPVAVSGLNISFFFFSSTTSYGIVPVKMVKMVLKNKYGIYTGVSRTSMSKNEVSYF